MNFLFKKNYFQGAGAISAEIKEIQAGIDGFLTEVKVYKDQLAKINEHISTVFIIIFL